MRRPTLLTAALAGGALLLGACDTADEPEEVVPTAENPEREDAPEDPTDVEGADQDEPQDGPGSGAEGDIGGDAGILQEDEPG